MNQDSDIMQQSLIIMNGSIHTVYYSPKIQNCFYVSEDSEHIDVVQLYTVFQEKLNQGKESLCVIPQFCCLNVLKNRVVEVSAYPSHINVLPITVSVYVHPDQAAARILYVHVQFSITVREDSKCVRLQYSTESLKA